MPEVSYGRMIRSAVRGLWTGALDFFDAWDAMASAIRIGLTQAWHEGAAEMGVLPDELSPREQTTLEQMIAQQFDHISGFLEAIEQGSKERGGKLGPLLKRAEIWTHRYVEARNRAKTMAGEDQKLMWVLGQAEHCSTCLKLADKVKRASQWDAHVRPQDPRLECGGWKCQCDLVPTTEPMSKGPLPGIP